MTDVTSLGRRSYLPARRDRLWLLKAGTVRTITYQEDGTAIALGLWSTGDIVGQSLSNADPYLVEALTPVEAVSIALSDWQPPVDVITSYLKHTEALMVVRTHRRAEAALLGLLQWLANRFGLQIDRGCLIDLKITHQDMADFSGLSRVTVTRLLRQFEEQGLIYRRSRQLILAETSDHWHYEI
ncbi:Crp/Fnr family transcriptional regulator [Leptolyngbya sp. KIOST-1]|uniref:Crp/Fnr family transcriptional regulator n=1 Tax=Leptolyngbya sp. KIOST-1 TaxID=1229172 RepID=UPI0005608E74|nr:Crp/Fnr family transcriptional regulator [Leptolyngbya sp. KIOST-1]